MSPGVGIDLIEIARIERALERRPRLAERLFTDRELDYAAARRRPGRHLAARFAAKEAVVKAFGRSLPLRDIEVATADPPTVVLHGRAAELAGRRGVAVAVSLTHTADHAAAIAQLSVAS